MKDQLFEGYRDATLGYGRAMPLLPRAATVYSQAVFGLEKGFRTRL